MPFLNLPCKVFQCCGTLHSIQRKKSTVNFFFPVYSPASPGILNRFTPLVATRARQRMTVLAATAVLFGAIVFGLEVILPLWVTRELGYSAGQWAQLRSLRMGG